MSIKTVRTANWLQTFAQIMEVDKRRPAQAGNQTALKAKPSQPSRIVKRRLSHD